MCACTLQQYSSPPFLVFFVKTAIDDHPVLLNGAYVTDYRIYCASICEKPGMYRSTSDFYRK